jgi:hypothetical protein
MHGSIMHSAMDRDVAKGSLIRLTTLVDKSLTKTWFDRCGTVCTQATLAKIISGVGVSSTVLNARVNRSP